MERYIAIGDIHGCYNELQELLKLLKPKSNDVIYALGDAFDRAGETNAFEVYKLIKYYNINYIYGNHDGELAYKVKTGQPIFKPWYIDWWNSFNSEAKDWFLANEKYYYWNNDRQLLFVHAGVNPKISFFELDPRVLCTVQCIYYDGSYRRIKKNNNNECNYWTNWFINNCNSIYKNMVIVYGHRGYNSIEKHCTPNLNITTYGIDTGCVRGGYLSALVIDEDGIKEISVKSKKNYFKESYNKCEE